MHSTHRLRSRARQLLFVTLALALLSAAFLGCGAPALLVLRDLRDPALHREIGRASCRERV